MRSLYIGLAVVCVVVICESLPIGRAELDNVWENDKLNGFFNEFVSGNGHNNVWRKKRGGIINVHLCPTGFGKFYGTGDCVPCYGYMHFTIKSSPKPRIHSRFFFIIPLHTLHIFLLHSTVILN